MHPLRSPGQNAVAASSLKAEYNQPGRENNESTPSEIAHKIWVTASPGPCGVTEEVPEAGTRELHKMKAEIRAAEIATIDFLLDMEKGG